MCILTVLLGLSSTLAVLCVVFGGFDQVCDMVAAFLVVGIGVIRCGRDSGFVSG